MAARCPVCENYFKSGDLIHLDDFNSMRHRECYEHEPKYIKDTGTYHEIIEKYSFFRDLIKH